SVTGPEGRPHCAAGEDLAAGRAVRDFQTLRLAGEHDRMVADHIAAAQRGEADISRAARARVPFPAPLGDGVEIDAPAARCGLAVTDRRTGGRIHLVL